MLQFGLIVVTLLARARLPLVRADVLLNNMLSCHHRWLSNLVLLPVPRALAMVGKIGPQATGGVLLAEIFLIRRDRHQCFHIVFSW